jgi:hypothetical protein
MLIKWLLLIPHVLVLAFPWRLERNLALRDALRP